MRALAWVAWLRRTNPSDPLLCELEGHLWEPETPRVIETESGPWMTRAQCARCGLWEGGPA